MGHLHFESCVGMMSALPVDGEVNASSGKCKETCLKRLRPGTSPDAQVRKEGS